MIYDYAFVKKPKSLLSSPHYDRKAALSRHLDILKAQKERIEALIALVKAEISGKQSLSFEPFSNVKAQELKEKYRAEVLERWGNTAIFKDYENSFLSQSPKDQSNHIESFRFASRATFKKLAQYQEQSPSCREVQRLVKEWQQYISATFYKCDNQMLLYLANLYVTDERFSNYINSYGSNDLASFFSQAIKIFCKKTRKHDNCR